MAAHNNHSGTAIGTLGGTLLAMFANIHADDIIKTAVLACIGAIVSFGVSFFLKYLTGNKKGNS